MDCFGERVDVKAIVDEHGVDKAEEILRERITKQEQRASLVEQKHNELSQLLKTHPEGEEVALRSILGHDLYGQATNQNVFYRASALRGVAEGKILELKKNLSTTRFGLKRNKEAGRDFTKAVFGEDATALGKKMADEWANASEWLRVRYNNAGGEIGKLDYGYLPQKHDRKAIHKTGADEWKNFIRPLIKDADAIDLDEVYKTIVTGGLNKVKDGMMPHVGKSTARRHADHRVLHFNDADSWIKYQEKFGSADPMANIDDHIRSITNDLAAMEVMGPNPMSMYRTLRAQAEAAREGAKPKEWLDYTEMMFNTVTARVDNDLDGIAKIGSVLQAARGLSTATSLGSAMLSALSDMGTLFTNTVYHGMSPFSVAKRFVKNFNIKNQDDAIRAGLGADVFNSEITQRFTEMGTGFWAKASEAVMRASMMNIWTESARKAFQAEYMHKLLNGRQLTDLMDDELIEMIAKVNQEADYAVVMLTARSRAITTMGKERGTVVGELARTGTQFKSFVITFMQQQGARIFMQGSLGSRIGYGSMLLTSTTMLGALAMMAKDAAKGFTPREGGNVFSDEYDADMKAKFWAAAAMQGGGFGIMGDLLFSDQNRFGGSSVPTILGPTGQLLDDTMKLTVGNVQQAIQGDTTNFGSEAIEYTNRHANPLKLWYTQLLIDQYISRNLKIMFDDEYERKEARKLRKRKREYGQEKFEFLGD